MSKKDNNNIVENEQSVKAAAEEVVDRVSSVKEETEEEHMALDDARRVKVLSPSMLVFKRFIRNKLAITGSIILIFMFLFSFLGGLISPYTESQVFNTTTVRAKPYALGSETSNLRFINAEGESLGGDNAAALYAIKERLTYTDGRYTNPLGTIYKVEFFSDDFVEVYRMMQVASVSQVGKGEPSVEITDKGTEIGLTAADNSAIIAASNSAATGSGITLANNKPNVLFNLKDMEMLAVKDSKSLTYVYAPVLVAMSSKSRYDACTPQEQATVDSYAFQYAFENAKVNGDPTFTVDGQEYQVETDTMAIITQEITNFNDPNYDPNFTATIEQNGFQQAVSDILLNSEDTSDKTVTVDGRQYDLKWVEYKVEAYTGRAGNAEMDALVAKESFKQAVYDCYMANAEEMTKKQVGGGYPKFPFTADGAEYTLEYSEEAGHYIVKEAGKDVYFAKLVFVNAYEITFKDDEGNDVVYAQASEWSASSVKKNGQDYAYVSNFKVIPDASRSGLVLDLDFMNKVRKACAAMPTAAQSGSKFEHEIWVVDVLEPKYQEGKLVNADDSVYEEFEDDRYGVIQISDGDNYKYFVITEEGNAVEIATTEKRSPVINEDDFGKYYTDAETDERIYTSWPLLISDNDGMYYEDQDGAKVRVVSQSIYQPAVEIETTDDGELKYYIDVNDNRYLASEVKVQNGEDGESFYFINEEGEQIDLKAQAVYTAVSDSDENGKFYTEEDGDKVYIVDIAAGETEDGYTVTDAFGNERSVRFSIENVINKQSDDKGEYLVGVDGSQNYVDDIGIHTDDNGTPGDIDDDKMFVWVTGDDATADDLKQKKVFIKTTKAQNIAAEGDEGAYRRNMEFQVQYGNIQYTVMTNTEVEIFDSNGAPSRAHWLGTDNHGMDTLTRIMYGGRISLLVGFVVIFIEMLIGVIFGGISGYFGGIVDTIMMRFVDLFNCIPYWPMMLIGGSLMDAYNVRGSIRIFVLVGIMGILGWTGTARIVRGQILSLREQDFMVATEAGGIRVSRRIFKHLVPNVMPLLIVQATMGLGSIIISEATLSFLGLGVQFPQASWGSIINSIQTAYEMTNYWYVWVPTGLCIMLAVLGFNFVGDGLRDAFDPKMKR